MKPTIFVCTIIFSLWTAAQSNSSQPCYRQKAATELESQLRNLTQNPDPSLESKKVEAIRTLGEYRCSSSVNLLIPLLDYKRPLTDAEKHGYLFQPLIISSLYPASEALMSIGESSIPSLATVLADQKSSDIKLTNAAFTVMQIKSDNPRTEIELLNNALPRQDFAARARADSLLNKAVSWCGPRHLAECQAAIPAGPSSAVKQPQ